MVLIRRNLTLSSCLPLLLSALPAFSQQPTTTSTAPQQAQTSAPAPEAKPASDGEGRLTGDGVASIGLFYWYAPNRPQLRTGHASIQTDPSDLDFPGKAKPAPGVVLSLPAKGLNTLRFSYFQTSGQGNTVVNKNLAIFSVGYVPGDYLSAHYKLQNAKVSLEYLSWPFPVKESRFRIKTLWELQYTAVKAFVDAPLKPTEDSEGNAVTTYGERTLWYMLPTVGLGMQYLATKHFRLEGKASGMTIPHHAALWDAEATAAYRFGQWEIQFGAKGFHFKSSPKQEEYVKGTLSGGFFGLRWYP